MAEDVSERVEDVSDEVEEAEEEEEDPELGRQITLAKIAEIVMKSCPHFGKGFNHCQEICEFYDFCDKLETTQDPGKLYPLNFVEGIKKTISEFLKALNSSNWAS